MMKRSIFLLFFLICYSVTLSAQIQLTGSVKDTQQKPLASVVVNAYDTRSDNIEDYSITNTNGQYSLSVNIPLEYIKLVFSMIGFETIETRATDVIFPYNVVMKESDIELEEVVVSGVPIRVVGDTITYSVSAIKNENDVTVEDVLKNIPGITVEDNGHILYNGKGINKFYIEGMDLLSGRYALATRNINADDIASVSVYENHQPKRTLKDIEFSDAAALNIKLKKQGLLHPVGNVGISSGIGEKWLKGTNNAILLLHPSFQNLSTLKYSDYQGSYNYESGLMYDEYDVNTSSVASKLCMPKCQRSDAPDELFNQNKAFSTTSSNLIKMKNNCTLNMLGGYVSDDISNSMCEERIYWNNLDDNIVLVEANTANYLEQKWWVEGKYENNSDKLYLLNNLSTNGLSASSWNHIISQRDIGQDNKMNDFHFNNVTDLILHFNRNVIRYNSVVSYVNTPKGILQAINDDCLFLSQSVTSAQLRVRQMAAYGWILSKSSLLNAELKFDGSWDKFNMYREHISEVNTFEMTGRNLLTSLQFEYTYRTNDFNLAIKVPLCLRNIYYKTDKMHKNKNDVFPLFGISAFYRFRNGFKCNLSYSHNNVIGGLSDFVTTPISTSYKEETVFGTGRIVETRSKNLSSLFTYSDYISGLSGTLMVSRIWNSKNCMSVSEISQDAIKHSYNNKTSDVNIFTSSLFASKKIYDFGLAISLNANMNIINSKYIRQSLESGVQNVVGMVDVGAKKTICDGLFIAEMNYMYETIWQEIKALNMTSSGNNMELRTNISCFPIKSLELGAKASYKYDKPQGYNKNENIYINAYAKYKYKNVEYMLVANNLTNRKRYCSESFSSGDVYYSMSYLKPTQFVFSAKFSIR